MTQQTGSQTDGSRPGTPRWVKALALGATVVVLVIVIVMLMAGGEHGPGRHSGAVDPIPSAADAPYV